MSQPCWTRFAVNPIQAARRDNMQSFTPRTTRRQFLGLGLGLAAQLPGCAPPGSGAGHFVDLSQVSNLAAGDGNAALEPALPASNASDPFAPLRRGLATVPRRDGRVAILQLGDSHTAGPVMVSRLRTLFQDRYGGLGPGRLAPGAAPRYYRPGLVQIEQTGPWQPASALRSSTPGPFGVTCHRLSTADEGSTIRLRSTEAQGFDRLMVDVWMQPGGGRMRIGVDGAWSPAIPTAGPGRPYRIVIDLPGRHRDAAVEVLGGGPVALLSWGVDRRGAGVMVEGHGVNGATIDMLGHLDPAILRRDLAAIPPALIILAFGTNEAADASTTEDGYAARLADKLRLVKQMSPGSGILLLGAPDSGRRGGGPGSCRGVRPLPSLAEVQSAQRRVARAERVGYWDWAQEVTRGVCQLNALSGGAAPMMQRDHVHFTADGYRLTADRLFEYLMRQVAPAATRAA